MKMSDVFDLPLDGEELGIYDSVCDKVIGGFANPNGNKAAAHAINQHDELVELNEELVEALTAIKNDLLERADLDSQDMKAVACDGSVWVQVQDALNKTKELNK